MRHFPLESIRQAVNSGEFERAQLLWNQCAAGLADDLDNRCLTEARLGEVRELVEWSRTVALCERAHMQDQLNRLQAELRVAVEYDLPIPPPAHRIVEASY